MSRPEYIQWQNVALLLQKCVKNILWIFFDALSQSQSNKILQFEK